MKMKAVEAGAMVPYDLLFGNNLGSGEYYTADGVVGAYDGSEQKHGKHKQASAR
jgi:hypothetical protein